MLIELATLSVDVAIGATSPDYVGSHGPLRNLADDRKMAPAFAAGNNVTMSPIFQYAYFVDDLASAAQRWAEVAGAGPFFVAAHHRADTFTYRGTAVEADVSYAFGYSGEAQIQLIVQHDDQSSIYRDMYPSGNGFHHVARLVVDYAAERQRMLDAGFELACELHANDIDACYFDTRAAIGGFTELHSHTERIVATFARWRQAHLAWDGTGDPLRTHVSGT